MIYNVPYIKITTSGNWLVAIDMNSGIEIARLIINPNIPNEKEQEAIEKQLLSDHSEEMQKWLLTKLLADQSSQKEKEQKTTERLYGLAIDHANNILKCEIIKQRAKSLANMVTD